MITKKAIMLRFMDLSNPDSPTYVTIFLDGARYGYIYRVAKKNMIDATTIRPNKDLLYEVKLLGKEWHNINRTEFLLRLSNVNSWRRDKDMPIVVISEIKDEDPKHN